MRFLALKLITLLISNLLQLGAKVKFFIFFFFFESNFSIFFCSLIGQLAIHSLQNLH